MWSIKESETLSFYMSELKQNYVASVPNSEVTPGVTKNRIEYYQHFGYSLLLKSKHDDKQRIVLDFNNMIATAYFDGVVKLRSKFKIEYEK